VLVFRGDGAPGGVARPSRQVEPGLNLSGGRSVAGPPRSQLRATAFSLYRRMPLLVRETESCSPIRADWRGTNDVPNTIEGQRELWVILAV
jgi:hypothetical protein